MHSGTSINLEHLDPYRQDPPFGANKMWINYVIHECIHETNFSFCQCGLDL